MGRRFLVEMDAQRILLEPPFSGPLVPIESLVTVPLRPKSSPCPSSVSYARDFRADLASGGFWSFSSAAASEANTETTGAALAAVPSRLFTLLSVCPWLIILIGSAVAADPSVSAGT
jgi:hypothetical protein